MTAEIAILNKSAIALAADSAVTISAGSNQEKIFDSADKLFQLSCDQPLAIMLNNNMHFMEVPLDVIVKSYRSKGMRFDLVEEAAIDFLDHLQSFGKSAPDAVRTRSVRIQIDPMVTSLNERAHENVMEALLDSDRTGQGDFIELRERYAGEGIAFLRWLFARNQVASFLNGTEIELTELDREAVRQSVNDCFQVGTPGQRVELADLILENPEKNWLYQPTTGVIVAGYGETEIFPTLKEFSVVGMLGGALKFQEYPTVDIDRNGHRARVLPFAQREMVERFLYGLDGEIERKVKTFCQQTISKISDQLLSSLELDENALTQLRREAEDAETAFLESLQEEGFSAIRSRSQAEIEDMVEFMPKPEMARMAEALINLTSIKRRVSRGMETVGGPIDVAVISKAEGFVWIRRKHYFPPELNARYFERI